VFKTPSKWQTLGLRGLTVCICLVAVALLGGAGRSAASTTTKCNNPDPTGRQFCVTLEDSDGVSPSGLVVSGNKQVNVTAYQFYKFDVSNVAGSTLTNGTVKLVLTDNVSTGGSVNSTAAFVPAGSASFCSLTSTNPNTVTCTLANLAANATAPTFVVAYRTSKTADVSSTDAAVTVSFKEGSNPNGANPSSVSLTENTSLEPNAEASVTWSPPGLGVAMGTSPTFDNQFTTMQYTVPTGKKAFVSTINESAGNVCAPSLTQCYGELVTTDLSGAEDGTFTRANLFHLTMTMSLDLFQSVNTKFIKVSHRLEGGGFEVLTQDANKCTASPPTTTESIPCILVTTAPDKKPTLVIVDVWAYQNGGWMTGN